MLKIFRRVPDGQDTPENPGRRMFLKKAAKLGKDAAVVTAGVAIGLSLKSDSRENRNKDEEIKIETEVDYTKDFNIGIAVEDNDKVIDKIIDNNEVELISGGEHYYLDGYGLPYKRKAFAQMTEKYGKERIKQFLDFLEVSYPSKDQQSRDSILVSWGKTLPRMAEEGTEEKVRLNKKLYNIAGLMEKGRLEKLAKLLEMLKKEGYSKVYDFSWSEKQINNLFNDDEERKALLEFTSKVDGFKYIKLKDYIGNDEKFYSMTYKEKLQAYEALVKLEK